MHTRALHQWVWCVATVFAAVACFRERVRDAPPDSTIAKLQGRCVTLKRPVLLVSASDEAITDSYLAPANNRASSAQLLAVGDDLVVERVVLKRAVEGRYAIIVGRCKNKYVDRKISLFLLFNAEWTKQAEGAAFDGRVNSPPRIGQGTLAQEWAAWCQ